MDAMTDEQARKIVAKVNEICKTARCADCRFFYEDYSCGHKLGCLLGNWSATVTDGEKDKL